MQTKEHNAEDEQLPERHAQPRPDVSEQHLALLRTFTISALGQIGIGFLALRLNFLYTGAGCFQVLISLDAAQGRDLEDGFDEGLEPEAEGKKA